MSDVEETRMENNAIVWFTNNLRVKDNNALQDALEKNSKVLGVYFFDPRHFGKTKYGFKKTEKFRAKFLIESVRDLQRNLRLLNISLLVIQGKPEEYFSDIISSYKIHHIYHLNEWTQEEAAVIEHCKSNTPKHVKWNAYFDQLLFHPEDIPFKIKETPSVFTQFRKKIEKHTLVRPERYSVGYLKNNFLIITTRIPSLQDLGYEVFEVDSRTVFPFSGGETQALQRLYHYIWETQQIRTYKETRNGLIGVAYSSKFSAWLANGSLSPKTIYHHVEAYEKNHGNNSSTYWLKFELIWRDFFKFISLKHGNDIFKIDGILGANYSWENDLKKIEQWIKGQTNEPFVNANMNEIAKTGWMSNRGRQNVASYFSKYLQLDWRIGAAYFESMLIDYDVHSNYGNWMYVAGVGNDPRDRVFNITLQANNYDPNRAFQNMWLENVTSS